MGILVKQYKNGTFGLWTTIADGYITDPAALTKEEAIETLCERVMERATDECKKIRNEFPCGWTDKDTYKRIPFPAQSNDGTPAQDHLK